MKLSRSWAFERARHILKHEGMSTLARKATGLMVRVLREGVSVVPFQAPSLEDQYRMWLRKEHEAIEKGPVSRGESGDGQANILISAVILSDGLDGRKLQDTLASVVRQSSPNWEVVVVCRPIEAEEARNIFQRCGIEESHIGRLHIAAIEGTFGEQLASGVFASSGEFVWTIRAGDQLHAEALRALNDTYRTSPRADVFYSDDDRIVPDGRRTAPFFKPAWSPELILSVNYISYSMAFRRAVGGELLSERPATLCATQYDWILWLTEKTDKIVRIPRILYHSMQVNPLFREDAVDAEQHAASGRDAVERALCRRGIDGRVECLPLGGLRVRYQLSRNPLVSLLIPTKDRVRLLARCLDSVSRLTSYTNFEIIVLDNGSESNECISFLRRVAEQWTVVSCPGPFNFSAMNNRGAASAQGDYLLFLNDDTEVIAPEWLTIMVEQALRPHIGAVGAKLLFPNGRIQHGGIVLGIGGIAGHAFRHSENTENGYHGLPHLTRNCSAVSAACMMVSKRVFVSVGGFDEELSVEFNDVDLCLRIQQEGYRVVYAPDAVLYHYENATRKGMRVPENGKRFCAQWEDLLARGDPYYNPNLTLLREDWSLRV